MTPTPPELPAEFVAPHKRRRIIDAMTELSAGQGYRATKIADILRCAGVAQKTLYDNFEGKEEIFLDAFDCCIAEARIVVERECTGGGNWEERIEAGLAAFLRAVAERPAAARMSMVEAPAAIPASTARHDDAMCQFVELLRRVAPSNELPNTIEEMLVGGIAWIVSQQIQRGGAETVEDLLPELTEFLLAPYRRVAEPG